MHMQNRQPTRGREHTCRHGVPDGLGSAPSHGKGEYHGVAGLPLPQEQEEDQDDVDAGAKDDDGETGDVLHQFPIDVAHYRAGDS